MILKERIMTQKFQIGDPLSEVAIANDLKVSRTPVREAILQLQKDALVELIPNRGAFVTFISHKELKNIFQLRQILEGAAAKMAADYIDHAKLEKLENEFLSLQNKKVTYEKQQMVGIQLHDLILQATANEKILDITQSIREQMRALCLTSIKSPGRTPEAIAEHLKLISALKKRDRSAAEHAMVVHLENIYKTLIDYVG